MIGLKKTADGSYTLYREDMDEHYHSFHGARTESEHVFIKNGLSYLAEKQNEIYILEIGFGTGYNAILSLLAAPNTQIHYTGIELHPVAQELYRELAEKDPFLNSNQKAYLKLMDAQWEDSIPITEWFKLRKQKADFHQYPTNEKFDLIYYDAFGFRAQDEMWQDALYQKLFDLAAPEAVIVTYAAKGIIRRGLENVGWKMERLPGPPGKREMLRGTK